MPEFVKHIKSAEATDDFTVRVFDQAGWSLGSLYIGFSTNPASAVIGHVVCEHGACALLLRCGFVVGSTEGYFPSCRPFRHGILRCVVDRTTQSVCFYLDGTPYGRVAWPSVASTPTFALVTFRYPGTSVEFL